jgi:hypothetical protein
MVSDGCQEEGALQTSARLVVLVVHTATGASLQDKHAPFCLGEVRTLQTLQSAKNSSHHVTVSHNVTMLVERLSLVSC